MPGLYGVFKTYSAGETLTAADLNSTDLNHITNQTAQMTDDYSADTAQSRTQTSPATLATSLAGELERLRYMIALIGGATNWDQVAAAALHGGCQLTLSGSTLKLSPKNGNGIIVNSALMVVPDAGITLAVGAALTEGGVPAASTTYYAYVYNNGGTLTLQASATTHATQAGTGVEIRSGDATRSLVGMARTTAGTAWADSATQRFVRSWFNDPGIGGVNNFTATRSTASVTYVELSTEIRVEFLAWTGEIVEVLVTGIVNNETTSVDTGTSIGFDGTNQENAMTGTRFTTTGVVLPLSLGFAKTGLSEGYHYATVLGAAAGGTGNWYGAAYTADTTYIRRTTLSLRTKR